MSPLPTVTAASSAIIARSGERLRGAGSSSSSRTLDGEHGDTYRDARTAQHRSTPSHSGTQEAAPLWHGPRLRPAFVAQVLGQVMMDARETALSLAPAAYRNRPAQIPPGAFFSGDI